MSSFWSIWIILLFLICNAGLVWLLFANRKSDLGENQVKSHVYDGIEEYDNPLPSWFFNLFLATIIFAFIYLALFPGLGNFKGLLGWTSQNQWQESVDTAEAEFIEITKPLMAKPAKDLTRTAEALKMGQRIFKNNCAICHGVNAKGSYAFPNLTDNDWLYGGSEEAIKYTLNNGRQGLMPPWGAALGQDIDAMAQYVIDLGQKDVSQSPMQAKFEMLCSACHAKDGSGNQMLGGPNLRDDIWLYGGSHSEIKITLEQGRNGNMPAFKDILTPERIHLVTTYVLSLSENTEQ